MEQEKHRIYRRLLAGFFIAMLLFTILSRIVDAKETARVKTAYPGRGSVTKTVRGTGVIEAGEERGVPIREGLRIREIAAPVGTKVKEGDILFSYTEDSILERLGEVKKAIRRLELEMEQETERCRSFQGVTEEELALQALELARREQERQRGKLLQAEEEYERQTARLRRYYKKRLELSEEELIRTSYSDYDQSRTDYQSIKLEKNSQIRSIKRQIAGTEAALEKLRKKQEKAGTDKDSETASGETEESLEEEIEALEEKLSDLTEDLEDAEDSWDLKVDRAREEMKEKEDIYDSAGEEADSARLALKEAYENGLRQEEQTLRSEREAMELADQAAESAVWALENARKNDTAKALTQKQAERLAFLQNEARRLDLEDWQEEKAALEALLAADGAVYAGDTACVSRVELEKEKKTDGSERYLLSCGSYQFRGTFDREENGTVSAGEEMELTLEGEVMPVSAAISQVDLITDPDTGTVTAPLEAGMAALGQKASFEVKRSSEIYGSVIPSGALRRDTGGWYCLAARKQKTILGEEYRAVRVDVKLIFAGDTTAAVEGALSEQEPVITGSDRGVGAGDRVRLMTELIPTD